MSLQDKIAAKEVTAIVKKILIADVNALQIKTIKAKFVNQLERWDFRVKIDMDWCEVLGYFKDGDHPKFNMVIFKYKNRLYLIDHVSFFTCLDIVTLEKMNAEFAKFPQLFVE